MGVYEHSMTHNSYNCYIPIFSYLAVGVRGRARGWTPHNSPLDNLNTRNSNSEFVETDTRPKRRR